MSQTTHNTYPRQSSRNSIQVFLKPDQDTIDNLDFGLVQLRGTSNNNNNSNSINQQQVPDHAFQVATLLLSHSRLDYVREGIQIMERLTFRAFEEYRHLTMISAQPINTGTAVSTSSAIVGTVINNNNTGADNKQTEEEYQRQKLMNGGNNANGTASDNRAATIQRDRQRAKEMLVSGYFLLGVGQFKLDELSNARNCVERVLELEPHHPQATALRDMVDELLMRNAAIGVGVLAVGVMGVAALVKGFFR